ncbi:TATA-binding protein, variant 3 [Lathyrus oleraceus]|uniref:TATA-binding protein, variant 3 n=1 Tax=Pisum sativum TaxID=3888 RepID=A0A9D4WTB5_PEA|nr:TATA-binding protein, variant 3 [Pisum sativum]
MLNLSLSGYFIKQLVITSYNKTQNYSKTQKNKQKQNLYNLQNAKSRQERFTHTSLRVGGIACRGEPPYCLMNEALEFVPVKMSRLELGVCNLGFVNKEMVRSGSLRITRSRNEIYTAFENIYPVLTEFRKNQQWYGSSSISVTFSIGSGYMREQITVLLFCFLPSAVNLRHVQEQGFPAMKVVFCKGSIKV